MQLKNFSYYDSLIEKISENKLKSSGRGASKICYTFPTFVILKSLVPNDSIYKKAEEFNRDIQISNDLRNLGLNVSLRLYMTTRPHDKDFLDFYQVQERVSGTPLAMLRNSCFQNLYNYTFNENLSKDTDFEKLQTERLKYNCAMQKRVLTAPDSQIIKFLNDFKNIYKLGIFYDCHPENLFYSKNKGFWFIDLDYSYLTKQENLEGYKKYFDAPFPKDPTILNEILHNSFTFFAKGNLQNCFYNNLIRHRLFDVLANSILSLDDKEYKEYYNLVFNQNTTEETKNEIVMSDKQTANILSSLQSGQLSNETKKTMSIYEIDQPDFDSLYNSLDGDFVLTYLYNKNTPEYIYTPKDSQMRYFSPKFANEEKDETILNKKDLDSELETN